MCVGRDDGQQPKPGLVCFCLGGGMVEPMGGNQGFLGTTQVEELSDHGFVGLPRGVVSFNNGSLDVELLRPRIGLCWVGVR